MSVRTKSIGDKHTLNTLNMHYGEIISVSLNINVNSVEINPLILLFFSFDKTMKVGIDNKPLLFTNNYIVFVTNEVKADNFVVQIVT